MSPEPRWWTEIFPEQLINDDDPIQRWPSAVFFLEPGVDDDGDPTRQPSVS
jgi:hypothetical protein